MENIIDTFALFRNIPKHALQDILNNLNAQTVEYKKDEFILRSSQKIDFIGLLISGSALIIQEDFWGNRHILSSIDPGQCFAETFACVPEAIINVDVIAQTKTTVLFLNMSNILSDPSPYHEQIIKNLLSDLARKNLHFNEKISHMAKRSTRTKILSYLSSQAKKHKSAEFTIPFSRQQLADYLSVDRSGLSNELCKMRDEGLLEFHKNYFILKQ